MGEITIPFHGGKLVVPHEDAVHAWLEKAIGAAGAPRKVVGAVPRLGEYWDGQGGIYAGVMPIADGQFAHRIVSVDEAEDLEYGGYNHKTDGADNKLDGLLNTTALIHDSVNHPAAKWCADYVKDGHSDFYLPAQRELSLTWATIAQVFGPHWYWSSTQFSAGHAWCQDFGYGSQSYGPQHSEFRARAVRRLSI